MRLWHKNLIYSLPRQQLLGQWRECCLIAKSISKNGTPNHILVNKIMDYPIEHFYTYATQICSAMISKGYKCDFGRFLKWIPEENRKEIPLFELFSDWHDKRYLTQCYYNLQEKYDCGGISEEEWKEISRVYSNSDEIDKIHTIYHDLGGSAKTILSKEQIDLYNVMLNKCEMLNRDYVYLLMYGDRHEGLHPDVLTEIIRKGIKDKIDGSIKFTMDGKGFCYFWGMFAGDSSYYEFSDYGKTWAFTKEELINYWSKTD